MRAALVIALTVSVAGAAAAQTTAPEAIERAEAIYENGALLFDEGEYEAAILAFEEAYALTRLPLLLYNIANAYERLSDFERAIDYLNQYRAFADPNEREALRSRAVSLQEQLEEVRATQTEDVSNEPDESVEEPIEEPVEVAATTEPDVEPEAEQPPDEGLGTVQWILINTAVASLGAGVAFGLLANDHGDNYEATCTEVGGNPVCREGDEFDDWQSAALGADISFGIAAASVIGFVLLLVLDSDESPRDDVAAMPLLMPEGAGVLFEGEF